MPRRSLSHRLPRIDSRDFCLRRSESRPLSRPFSKPLGEFLSGIRQCHNDLVDVWVSRVPSFMTGRPAGRGTVAASTGGSGRLTALGVSGQMELGKTQRVCFTDDTSSLEGRGGSRHYSREPDPWHPEDDWGPITAAATFLIILAGLIVYGSGVHL